MFAGMLGYMLCGAERLHLEGLILAGFDPCKLECAPCCMVVREVAQWHAHWHGGEELPTRSHRLAMEVMADVGMIVPDSGVAMDSLFESGSSGMSDGGTDSGDKQRSVDGRRLYHGHRVGATARVGCWRRWRLCGGCGVVGTVG